MPIKNADEIEAHLQACSSRACLLPGNISIPIKIPADTLSTKTIFDQNKIKNNSNNQTSMSSPNLQSLNYQVTQSFQNAIVEKSFLLYPLLLLAGLLMNLKELVAIPQEAF